VIIEDVWLYILHDKKMLNMSLVFLYLSCVGRYCWIFNFKDKLRRWGLEFGLLFHFARLVCLFP
jgi:hypothetical protein